MCNLVLKSILYLEERIISIISPPIVHESRNKRKNKKYKGIWMSSLAATSSLQQELNNNELVLFKKTKGKDLEILENVGNFLSYF